MRRSWLDLLSMRCKRLRPVWRHFRPTEYCRYEPMPPFVGIPRKYVSAVWLCVREREYENKNDHLDNEENKEKLFEWSKPTAMVIHFRRIIHDDILSCIHTCEPTETITTKTDGFRFYFSFGTKLLFIGFSLSVRSATIFISQNVFDFSCLFVGTEPPYLPEKTEKKKKTVRLSLEYVASSRLDETEETSSLLHCVMLLRCNHFKSSTREVVYAWECLCVFVWASMCWEQSVNEYSMLCSTRRKRHRREWEREMNDNACDAFELSRHNPFRAHRRDMRSNARVQCAHKHIDELMYSGLRIDVMHRLLLNPQRYS